MHPEDYPLKQTDLLRLIARETAKMSYPGGMSRGKSQVVKGETKDRLERYFADHFPLREVWSNAAAIAGVYDRWHARQATAIADFLVRDRRLGHPGNTPFVVAAKFLDTFMHQLMKYEWARPLWPALHLPLDSQIFYAFACSDSLVLAKINARIGERRAYAISREDYQFIQNTLWEYLGELNRRDGAEFQVCSRIELNYLWLD